MGPSHISVARSTALLKRFKNRLSSLFHTRLVFMLTA
jgi:hypothetical protein